MSRPLGARYIGQTRHKLGRARARVSPAQLPDEFSLNGGSHTTCGVSTPSPLSMELAYYFRSSPAYPVG